MSVQNFVDLADIIAVRFECGQCHAAITVPLGSGASEHASRIAMNKCGFCGAPSGFEVGTEEQKSLIGFVKNLERIVMGEKRANLRLRFEVTPPNDKGYRIAKMLPRAIATLVDRRLNIASRDI